MMRVRHFDRRPAVAEPSGEIREALARYANGELRTIIFRDLVLNAIGRFVNEDAVVL